MSHLYLSNTDTMVKFFSQMKSTITGCSGRLNWEGETQYDPSKRKLIEHYHPNFKDLVRRKYLLNGPCQPRDIDFESSEFGGK